MSEEGTIYYFAYGANMNFNTFLDRCSGAKFVDAGILSKHRFSINSRGVATVVMDESAFVYGILWLITPNKHSPSHTKAILIKQPIVWSM